MSLGHCHTQVCDFLLLPCLLGILTEHIPAVMDRLGAIPQCA